MSCCGSSQCFHGFLGVPSRRGVAGSQQSLQGVARPQHCAAVFILALIGCLLGSQAAHAETADSAGEGSGHRWTTRSSPSERHIEAPPEGTRTAAPREVSPAPRYTYRAVLALGYAVPASFTAGTVVFADMWKGAGADMLAGGMIATVVTGPMVHTMYRHGRATAWAFLGNTSSMLGGLIIGATVGGNQRTDPSCTDVSSCEFQNAVYGAVFGATAGSLIWGTFDVIYNAERPVHRPQRRVASSVHPIVGADEDGNREVQGMTLNLTGTF